MKWLLVVVGLLVVVVGVKAFLTMRGPSDDVLVKQALDEAIKASKEGRPGGVMDYLSDSLTINAESPTRRKIADFIKQSHPEIQVQNSEPVIRESEGTAQINSPVHIKLTMPLGGSTVERTIPNVTLRFQREDAREWLIIPTRQWRLKEVTVPAESVPADLISGFGGGF